MARLKIKVEEPPITLSSFILFGKYRGRIIREVIHDHKWITWYCQKTKRPPSPEVKTAIAHHKYLSQ